MAFVNTVVAPSWWAINASPRARLIHLLLMSLSDRDGIVKLESAHFADIMGVSRSDIIFDIRELESANLICVYSTDSGTWGWVPAVGEMQPTRGALKRNRNPALPPPPKESVQSLLLAMWGREPTKAECKRACPRAWGKVAAGSGSSVPLEDVNDVFEAWKNRQKMPGSCRLGAGSSSLIESALKEATPKQLKDLIAYAYEADEPGPRFWRGDNNRNRTYLGLDNLLVISKLQSRLQLVAEWSSNGCGKEEDGTDLGPLAAYRRQGPRGTKSNPDPRPKRLSDQCQKILRLLKQRGTDGVRTSELAGIALKYTGRLSEIRGAGHDVVLAERCNDGNNLYVLVGGTSGLD